jgi:hypothetical protein
MSDGATKCHVGRSTCARRISPASNARSIAACVRPFARCAIAQVAPA